jgi:hypothetical protein
VGHAKVLEELQEGGEDGKDERGRGRRKLELVVDRGAEGHGKGGQGYVHASLGDDEEYGKYQEGHHCEPSNSAATHT